MKMIKMKKMEVEMDNAIKLSYSKLSDFDRNGPKALIEREILKGEGINFGTIVDNIVSDKEKFKKKFIISTAKTPTAMLKTLADFIIENYTYLPSKSILISIIKNLNLWKNIKDEDKVLEKLNKNFWIYLKEKIENKKSKKSIIDLYTYMDALDCISVLKSHKFSKSFFTDNTLYQIPFKIKYKEVYLRGIVDMIEIDHKNKTIQLTDLKTGSIPAKEFPKSFVKYRYFLQGVIYTLASIYIKEQFKIKDYEVLQFKFLYISRFEKLPIIYTLTDKWYKAGINGFILNSYTYKGVNKLISEVKWHINNNIFKLSKDIYENNGIINLKDNLITVIE